ncbi:ComEC/Rec2 family competence protein [Alkalihalophilus sp. As8PL]|uniref:ComEC/Rec2 family competence protein n=1 Tax=Alkalihalophilus sp. As8PL TaxID=3237103 RepID=A0AB39BUC8_9BACI
MRITAFLFVRFSLIMLLWVIWNPLIGFASQHVELGKVLEGASGEVSVLFLDLPEGESVLLHTADKHSILVGTGTKGSFKELKERLDCLAITSLDQVILPNLEDSYSGATQLLIDDIEVKQLIVAEQGLKWSQELFSSSSTEVISWSEDTQYQLHPDLHFSVLKSSHSIVPSLNMDVKIGIDHRLFLANEASKELEHNWMEKDLSTVNVLKVAEYGKARGTDVEFLEALDPEVAVIFNLHDHIPSSSVLERLQETWIDTYETKQHGTIMIKVRDNDYDLFTIRF